MTKLAAAPAVVRCGIYTRKSTEEGLEQEFNSLDAQREAAEAFIASQAREGWVCLPTPYDDGGFSGGNMDRPALKRLLADIASGRIDCVVLYKVDRLSRSLLDFAKMMETFEKHQVAFVSVTQQFNSATSMGRLVLHVLLSFAQFEREIISERTRDKMAANRRKGKWSGGRPLWGYDVDRQQRKLVVNEGEAVRVRAVFALFLQRRALWPVVEELHRRGWVHKRWTTRAGVLRGGEPFSTVNVQRLLTNPVYIGKVGYKGEVHAGEHEAIVDAAVWRQVQGILRRNGRGKADGEGEGHQVRHPSDALLAGRLWCVACEKVMSSTHTTNRSGTRYRYYVCRTHTGPSKSVPRAVLEAFVIEQIRRIGRDPEWQQALLAAAARQDQAQRTHLETERQSLEKSLTRQHADLRKRARQIESGRDNSAVLARLAELQTDIALNEERLRTIRGQMAALQADIVDGDAAQALASLDTVWETLSPSMQARVVELLVDRVDYDGAGRKAKVTIQAAQIRTLAAELQRLRPEANR